MWFVMTIITSFITTNLLTHIQSNMQICMSKCVQSSPASRFVETMMMLDKSAQRANDNRMKDIQDDVEHCTLVPKNPQSISVIVVTVMEL